MWYLLYPINMNSLKVPYYVKFSCTNAMPCLSPSSQRKSLTPPPHRSLRGVPQGLVCGAPLLEWRTGSWVPPLAANLRDDQSRPPVLVPSLRSATVAFRGHYLVHNHLNHLRTFFLTGESRPKSGSWSCFDWVAVS